MDGGGQAAPSLLLQKPLVSCVPHRCAPEVSRLCHLPAGTYRVVPSTYLPDTEGTFTVTIATRIDRWGRGEWGPSLFVLTAALRSQLSRRRPDAPSAGRGPGADRSVSPTGAPFTAGKCWGSSCRRYRGPRRGCSLVSSPPQRPYWGWRVPRSQPLALPLVLGRVAPARRHRVPSAGLLHGSDEKLTDGPRASSGDCGPQGAPAGPWRPHTVPPASARPVPAGPGDDRPWDGAGAAGTAGSAHRGPHGFCPAAQRGLGPAGPCTALWDALLGCSVANKRGC